MELLDLFKKKPSKTAPPSEPPPAPGWDTISNAFLELYPGQTDPIHRAPLVHRSLDISDNAAALDGMSAYDAVDHWHFVTYGLTELYTKESVETSVSGFGYEFTFKLPKVSERPPLWAFNLLEALGKTVWNGSEYAHGNTIKCGPIDGRDDTQETALIVVRDPALPQPIATPHGEVEFLLLVGVAAEWRERVLAAHSTRTDIDAENPVIVELRGKNPKLITPTRTLDRDE